MKLVKLVLIIAHFRLLQCANILGIFMYPAMSHQIFYQHIWKELSLRGHNVTVITPNPLNDPSLINLTEIDIGFVNNFFKEQNITKQYSAGAISSMRNGYRIIHKLVELAMNNATIQKRLCENNQKFDVILTWFIHPFWNVLGHVFQAPVIGFWAMNSYEIWHETFGNQNHPVLYPEFLFNFGTDELSLYQKLQSTIYLVWNRFYYNHFVLPEADGLARKFFGNDIPYIGDLEKNLSLAFMKRNLLLHEPRPFGFSSFEIGSLDKQSPNPLPKDLQTIMDSAFSGVIYVSFGTNVKSSNLGSNLINVLLKTFSDLPYTVLWKWDLDHFPNKPKNVITRKWFPQRDLLAHTNMKIFLTHGGLQSIEQAIAKEVPMIGVPIFLDQEENLAKVAKAGIAEYFKIEALTKESLKNSIMKMVKDPKYKENIKRVKKILDDKARNGLETIMWWIEYVIRHKGVKTFGTKGPSMSWFEFLLLDVTLLCLISFLICCYFCYKTVVILINYLF